MRTLRPLFQATEGRTLSAPILSHILGLSMGEVAPLLDSVTNFGGQLLKSAIEVSVFVMKAHSVLKQFRVSSSVCF